MVSRTSRPVAVLDFLLLAAYASEPAEWRDWIKYVDGLRTAGRAAYKAAQSKDQDAMVTVSGLSCKRLPRNFG